MELPSHEEVPRGRTVQAIHHLLRSDLHHALRLTATPSAASLEWSRLRFVRLGNWPAGCGRMSTLASVVSGKHHRMNPAPFDAMLRTSSSQIYSCPTLGLGTTTGGEAWKRGSSTRW